MLQKLLLLALAGALGTLARYGLAQFVNRFNPDPFPLGTLVVNVVGCFVVGLLLSLFENRWPVNGDTRFLIIVGFMGAFTTFSAFILETGELARTVEWLKASANIFMQNGLGFAALYLGTTLGRTS